jgi:hypothetical protein
MARWLVPLVVRSMAIAPLPSLDPLKGGGVIQKWIGVEIGEREAEGLHRCLAGRIDAHHSGADPVIELEIR